MSSHFQAYMSRMKLIKRWGLMRSTNEENDMEHTLQVTMIAHMLCEIRRVRYHGEVDLEKVMGYALYHEVAEVITGDLASPIKYFNPQIKDAFKEIEKLAAEKLIGYLPEDLRESYAPLLLPNEQSIEWKLVKAADKIAAYLKCIEETGQGNAEFDQAASKLRLEINKLSLPEVQDFMKESAPSFALSLDGLN